MNKDVSMAGPEGFEPSTIDLEGQRAIQSALRTPVERNYVAT